MGGNGWIKLHRKLLESAVFQNEKALKLWVWCLLRANHAPARVLLGRQIINLNRGQFVMGSNKESKALKIAKTTFWRWLYFFESEQMLELKRTTKYTVVTIPNWDMYQEVELKRDTSGTQVGTNKNDKKEKNTSVAPAPQVVPVFVGEDSVEERPKSKPKYPHSKEVFSWFPDSEPSWTLNTTILKHSELLWKRGEEAVRGIIKFCQANESDAFFPTWQDPTSLERNWNRIIKFAERNNL